MGGLDMYHPSDFLEMAADQLVKTVLSAHGEMTRFKAALILALATFHDRGMAKELGAPNTVVWMVRQLGVAEPTAYEYLRVGTALQRHEGLCEAMLSGELSYSVIRLLIAHLDSHTEEELLELARKYTYRELKTVLAGTANQRDEPPREGLRIQIDEETGYMRLSANLAPENAARFLASLKIAELASLRDVSELDPEVFESEEALDEALREAEDDPVENDAELLDSPVRAEDGTPVDPRRSTGFGVPVRDNLLASFMSLVNMMRSNPTNKLRTPGAQVNLVVDEGGNSVLPSQPGAPPESLVGAALNGDVRAHFRDSDGITVAASKSRRLVSDAQVNVLMVLWFFQCAMPGCNHTRFIEFHHIRAFIDGGPTDVWNLIPLCSSCHSLVTEELAHINFAPGDRSRLIFSFAGGVRFISENRSVPMRLIDGSFRPIDDPVVLEDNYSFSDEAYAAATSG